MKTYKGSEKIIRSGKYQSTTSGSVKDVPFFSGCKEFELESDIAAQMIRNTARGWLETWGIQINIWTADLGDLYEQIVWTVNYRYSCLE